MPYTRTRKTADFSDIDIDAGDYIHTKKQFNMSAKIVQDPSWAEEPHVLAEELNYPVTTVKSFLKKLRDEEILEVKTLEFEGDHYVAVDDVTGAYLLTPSKNWNPFRDEYKRLKRQRRFQY